MGKPFDLRRATGPSRSSTVLAKASIPIVILPLLGFVVTVVLQLIMAVISSAVLAASGLSVAAYWEQLSWAPFFGWMLLVSAWARRAPFVWALMPPTALAIVEKIATKFEPPRPPREVSGARCGVCKGQSH